MEENTEIEKKPRKSRKPISETFEEMIPKEIIEPTPDIVNEDIQTSEPVFEIKKTKRRVKVARIKASHVTLIDEANHSGITASKESLPSDIKVGDIIYI